MSAASSTLCAIAVGIATLGCTGDIGASGESAGASGSSSGAGAAQAATPRPHDSLPSSFDDRFTTLSSEAGVVEKRNALIDVIWPDGALPTSMPNVTTHTAAEVGGAIPIGLDNLDDEHVLQLDFPTLNPMPPNGTDGGNGLAYLLSPREAPRHRVVILNTGHATSFDEPEPATNMRDVVQGLLTENYSVLLVYMPHYSPADPSGAAAGIGIHNAMFADGLGGNAEGDPQDATNYRYFFEPTITGINFLASDAAPGGAFTDIALAGLSGGGWTTTVVAALDTRPRLSVSVAGILPGFIENADTMDAEQVIRSRLGVGYADLCLLGAEGTALGGAPRRQTQALNRRDTCCFGERQYNDRGGAIGTWQGSVRLAEQNVRAALLAIGSVGRWRLEIDEMADHHMVSGNVLHDVLLAELDDDRKLIGAANVDGAMFYRGVNGDLWRRTFPVGAASIETDTGVPIASVASVTEGGPNTVDVFARDSMAPGGTYNLLHYYLPAGGPTWMLETLPVTLAADPVAVAGGGTYDVVGLGPDGAMYRLSSSGGEPEIVSPTGLVGPPALARWQGNLHVLARGRDLLAYDVSWDGYSWTTQPLLLALSGFPAAAACGDRLCVAGLGTDRGGYLGTIDASGTWSGWSALPGTDPLRGTPSIATTGAALNIYASTSRGMLGKFSRSSTAGPWTFTEVGAAVASPTAIQETGGAVVSAGQAGALWIHRSATAALGGWFD